MEHLTSDDSVTAESLAESDERRQERFWKVACEVLARRAEGRQHGCWLSPDPHGVPAIAMSEDERTQRFLAETAKDPVKARAFLKDAGILDESGELAEPFRDGMSVRPEPSQDSPPSDTTSPSEKESQ